MDRSGETVTGSEAFADDRDTSGTDPGEQAGLFTQTEDMDGQAALGGGTASQTDEGFFSEDGGLTDVDQSRPFAFDDYGPTSRRPVPDAERQEDDRFGGVDRRRLQGTGLAPSDPRIARQTEQQSRRDRNDPPGDLAEQLAAQRAAPTVTRPSATPATQLFNVGETESTAGDTDRPFREFVGTNPNTGERRFVTVRESVGKFYPQVITRDDEGQMTGKYTISRPRRDEESAVKIARSKFADLTGQDGDDTADSSESTRNGGTFDLFGAGGPSAEPAVSLFDVGETEPTAGDSNAPGEFVGRTGRGTEERLDVRQAGGQFYPQRVERDPETGKIVDQETLNTGVRSREGALETARQEFADQTDQDNDGTPDTAEVRIELPDSQAAEAGQLVARMGERGIVGDDVDEDTLARVRDELQTVREGDGTLNLTEQQAEAFGAVIDDAGGSLVPAQRPEGFDLLEGVAFSGRGADTRTAPGGQPNMARSSGETTREFDFGSRDIAQSVRKDIPDAALTDTYDGRHTSIEVDTSQLTDRQVDRLAGEAADATAFEDEKAGQVPLTDRERSEIDFTETTVPEARSAKGIFAAQGVDDWLSFFDERLSVDEQRGIAQRAAREDGGRRTDFAEESDRQRMAGAFRAESENLREYAIQGARQGDEEAIGVLVDEIGMDEQRARGFVEDTESDQERVEMVKTVVARVEANGRFTNPPPQDAPRSPGKRGRSSGQYIGDEVTTPADPGAPIRRDPETGQFFVAEGERGRSGPPFGSVVETQVQRGEPR
jgi:hypothetical protein